MLAAKEKCAHNTFITEVFTNPLKQQQKSGGAKAALLHC
jgi:hypothetical protein